MDEDTVRNDTEQRAASPPSLRCPSALRWRKASERKQGAPQEKGWVSRKGSGWRRSKKSLGRTGVRAGEPCSEKGQDGKA